MPNHMDPALEQSVEIALAHHRAGRMHEAELVYRQILQKQPKHPAALHYLGVIAGQLGHHEQALELLKMAAQAEPGNPEVHLNGGMVLQLVGRHAEAVDAFREALRLRPGWVDVINILGNSLFAQGHYEDALTQYQEALAIDSNFQPALGNLAATYKALSRWDDAAGACRRLIELSPHMPDAHMHLAIVLADSGKIEEAERSVKRALELDSENPDAWDLLGQILQQQNKLPEAAGCHLKAISINSRNPQYHANLGDAVLKQGHAHQAHDAYRKALELNPQDSSVHSRVLVAMGQSGRFGFREIYEEAVAWGRRHAHAVAETYPEYPNSRDPNRRIRIGYVSPNFTGEWIGELLANHDRAKVDVFCYSDGRPGDPATQALEASDVAWCETAGVHDERFCDAVRRAQIDILVDLAGHLPGNRLLAFARRPAPVQVTWGYPHTTGMTEMSYRIVNPGATDQLAAEKYHTEKLVPVQGTGKALAESLEARFREMWCSWCSGR